MTNNDERIARLIDEANKLKYSRRQIFRSGAALGLSSAGIYTVLGASGKAAAARAPPATRAAASSRSSPAPTSCPKRRISSSSR